MPSAALQLDVRSEPPARRHELIFDTYERLAPGSNFVLVNDYDPKPLYYQFTAEHPDQFTWDYSSRIPRSGACASDGPPRHSLGVVSEHHAHVSDVQPTVRVVGEVERPQTVDLRDLVSSAARR